MVSAREHNVSPVPVSGIEASALSASDYTFSYAGADSPALDGLTFSLDPGQFAVLCGTTGSGKSTLLHAFKPELEVAGNASGSIRIMGLDPATLSPAQSASVVGFVMQDPESQLVTDTVWHELAFGLENIAVEQEAMRRRVAETAHFFGIGGWFDRKVNDLSGGQKQLLNLAAVVVMQPKILLLDEPTSQLDPIAAKDFLDVLGRVNAELGITVLIIEHRLEDVLPMADKVLFLGPGGQLAYDGPVQDFISFVSADAPAFATALPAATRMAAASAPASEARAAMPVTVREGRTFLSEVIAGTCADPDAISAALGALDEVAEAPKGDVAIQAHDLWFRYGSDDPFVLRGVDFTVSYGHIEAIVGGNGAGKSTMLGALAGTRKPYRGSVSNPTGGKVALLTQDPKMLFVHDTLIDDLMEWRDYGGYGPDEAHEMLARFELEHRANHHPFDLSGGETQKAALAKLLLLDPDILLLDEPVKGVDAASKRQIGKILRSLALDQGKAVLFTAHDLEFVADTAQTCAMMFGCEITCVQDCHGFFQDNLFYSTATGRIARGLLDGCVTTADVACVLDALGARSVQDVEGQGGHA